MITKDKLRVREIGGHWYIEAKMVDFVTGGYKWITFDESPFDTRKEAEKYLPLFTVT